MLGISSFLGICKNSAALTDLSYLISSVTPAHTTKVTKLYLERNSIKTMLTLNRVLKETIMKIGHIRKVNLLFSSAIIFWQAMKLERENV